MVNDNCIFCKIVEKKIPCYKIYEDEKFLAFLDNFPLTPGHTLVIPKKHFRWVWDVEPAGEYFEVVTKIANHFRKQLNDEPILSMTIGELTHAHYHLLPPGLFKLNEVIDMSSKKNKHELEDKQALELITKLSLQ